MTTIAVPATGARVRIESIDVLRGIVMIVMALDHVRDFFGASGSSPTNLATTTVALFFTRWITNFCAPVFFLVTGTGAYLSLRRKSKHEDQSAAGEGLQHGRHSENLRWELFAGDAGGGS